MKKMKALPRIFEVIIMVIVGLCVIGAIAHRNIYPLIWVPVLLLLFSALRKDRRKADEWKKILKR